MAWVVPQYPRGEIERAGRALVAEHITPDALVNALAIVNNWRSSHSFPLNTMQVGLRAKARQVDSDAVVAQRIKRLSSIEAKLRRFDRMNLARMQDLGGCRAVVSNVSKVGELVGLYEESRIKHKLVRKDDYIANPQASGYRGVHLVYKYFSDRSATYNGLQIELQLRSPLQHAWATAVETVGTFLAQALKASQGHADWLRFFSLMGSALALRERTPLVPGTPQQRNELVEELRESAQSLDVERRLQTYGAALRTLEDPSVANADFFLVALNPGEGTVNIRGYARSELEQATADYMATERALDAIPGAEAVLVSVESLAALQRAYPNYFLDTTAFLRALQRATAVTPGRMVPRTLGR
jgi:hypothetical protein